MAPSEVPVSEPGFTRQRPNEGGDEKVSVTLARSEESEKPMKSEVEEGPVDVLLLLVNKRP